jgi:ketosteroid isomerase-like protein
VLAANAAFYAAFESRDLDALEDVWERTPRAVCTHPGWGTLRGWEQVRASFEAILRGDQPLQFIVTATEVDVTDGVAWVTCDENLWSEDVAGTVAALNLFVLDPMDGRWRMVAHHGSPVHGNVPDDLLP